MNVKTIGSLLLLALAGCHSTGPKEPPSEEQMMASWMAFATPGEAHKALAPRVGNWNMKVRMFMSPDAPPSESTGTSTMQWVMDGRYIQDTTTGEFNGQPFHGSGLTGYDNMKKAYVNTWIDNMGTAILVSEGSYDPRTKTFTYTGTMPDAMVANDYVEARTVETWKDDDHFVLRSYGPGPDGEEALAMEIEYTRAR